MEIRKNWPKIAQYTNLLLIRNCSINYQNRFKYLCLCVKDFRVYKN